MFPLQFRDVRGEKVPLKICPKHRERQKKAQNKYRSSPKGKEKQAEQAQKESTKIKRAITAKEPKFKARIKRYKDSSKGQETERIYRNREDVKKRKRLSRKTFIGRMGDKLRKLVSGDSTKSDTITRWTEFESEKDVCDFFLKMLQPWMSWENHGPHIRNNPYNHVWNIGHRIPKCMYDHTDANEVRKAWSKMNLFPQCARENLETRDRMPSIETLIPLREIWPKQWNNQIPV